ncbi:MULTISPECIES: anti-sigma factor [Pandoraea]|uniref:anti-sigma factor n=1 Tax=Pandoraea TaxID=93217 RepID=UPI001F5DB3C5|nr:MULTISPECIES: anti-sigma factor [Pandoraea]MCI3203903.1 RNA polymerase subunit sigma-70 [Pandoraea sp. LA3]MDN4581929.1 RNA polymerase subunit sigma-70 [Pandoraea capi]
MTPEELSALDELAGEYVLGTLTWERRRAVESRLLHEPVLAARVALWESRLQPLADTVAPLTPSVQLWQRISRSVSVTRHSIWRRCWDDIRLWRLASGAVTCTALVLAVILGGKDRTPTPRFVVVLASPQDKSPGWLVQVGADRKLRLIPLKSEPTQADKTLQLWTKADGWSGPVSLGLLRAGEPVEVSIENLPPLQPNQLFEITLEPPQGSPIGRPTGPILSIGRAVAT